MRRLRCAIEQIEIWRPELYLAPHIVAFVAVAEKYSDSPALFDVQGSGAELHWFKGAAVFRLEASWHRETLEKARRLRATMQAAPLVELASIATAMILTRRVIPLGILDVTEYGDRADYRDRKCQAMLEVSGTEVPSELGRRHREKSIQALGNPFGWDAYVVVCAFSSSGHRIRVSHHRRREAPHGEGTN
jgi:hypothetical protein